jgi:hypothetical protein
MAGGSNRSRVRPWKTELQRFAKDTGLTVHGRHFPPGTSKWNAVEHRLFSVIRRNWRGHPLTTEETLVPCIARTTTATGLTMNAEWDPSEYPTGLTVTDTDLAAVHLTPTDFPRVELPD